VNCGLYQIPKSWPSGPDRNSLFVVLEHPNPFQTALAKFVLGPEIRIFTRQLPSFPPTSLPKSFQSVLASAKLLGNPLASLLSHRRAVYRDIDTSLSCQSILFTVDRVILLSSRRAQPRVSATAFSDMAQHNNQRNSPHLNHLHNSSAPPSPSMSNSQQQGGQSRQPVSYPSPTSYPSPSLSSAQYSYPAPNNQQVSEPYRASPTGSNGSLSLPSMRSLDPLQQQQAQQHHMGSPLPPPVAQMAPYYHNQGQTLPHPSHQYPNVTSDPTGQNMRYALPVTDTRVMSGGRHKKVGDP
jgi:hypothetical protein